jgi:hypothetical protein
VTEPFTNWLDYDEANTDPRIKRCMKQAETLCGCLIRDLRDRAMIRAREVVARRRGALLGDSDEAALRELSQCDQEMAANLTSTKLLQGCLAAVEDDIVRELTS